MGREVWVLMRGRMGGKVWVLMRGRVGGKCWPLEKTTTHSQQIEDVQGGGLCDG
jgi:hypothetical protein